MKTKKLAAALAAVLMLGALSACTSAPRPAPIRTVPWKDGETVVYDVLVLGQKESTMTYTFALTDTVWQIDSVLDAPEGQLIAGVSLDRNTLTAVASYRDYRPTVEGEAPWRVDTVYRDGKMIVSSNAEGMPEQKEVTMPRNMDMDDNEVLAMVLRLFDVPLGDPFNLAIGIAHQYRTDVVTIGATEQKTITIGDREYACKGVKVGQTGSFRDPNITMWFSQDDSRTLVQLDYSKIVYRLQEGT
nr:DUF3108 domain-containing protein [bacterium]